MSLISLKNIGFKIKTEEKEVEILKNINLSFEAGKIYAITGPNGGGKSSIARMIMGINKPTKGKIFFNGEEINAMSISERAKMGIGYAFQHPARFKGLLVKDLLETAAHLDGIFACRCLRDIGLCPEDYMDRPLDNSLSGGEIKRIEIASLLAQNPTVRIFDEPEAGIDLWSFEQLVKVMKDTHKPETMTVIISHQEKILKMADEIILIVAGKVSLQGKQHEVWPKLRETAVCDCLHDCSKGGTIYAD